MSPSCFCSSLCLAEVTFGGQPDIKKIVPNMIARHTNMNTSAAAMNGLGPRPMDSSPSMRFGTA